MRNTIRWNRIAGYLFKAMLCMSLSEVCNAQALQESGVCPHCKSSGECVVKMSDYPAYPNTYGNPVRLMDCRNGECEGASVVERWKRSMQASHWGYPENFQRNMYGSSNRAAFASNIRDGAIERATLYRLDFYPEDSSQSQMLTPRGVERLEKAICVSQSYGSALRIERSSRPELDQLRVAWLVEHPSIVGAGITSDGILLIAKPMGIQATEAIRRYQKGILGSGNASVPSGSGGGAMGSSMGGLPSLGASGGSAGMR